MSPDHTKPAGKDDRNRPQEPSLKCPRCDSPNTKFCYYNNYSLTQPRHFCKTCRRYWTKGGALRNVPIGGGCRKNKKLKSPRFPGAAGEPPKDVVGSGDVGGLKFFQGISPAMDFQIGFPTRLHHGGAPATGMFTQFSYSGNSSNTCDVISSTPGFSLLDPNNSGGPGSSPPPLMGFSNFPFLSGQNQEIGSLNVHSNLASSIESLSSINQDLHWKLQQQRLGMIPSEDPLAPTSKPQPITFDISKQESCPVRKDHGLSTEWFFDNPFAPMSQSANQNSNGNWNGIEPWSGDIRQFTASLP